MLTSELVAHRLATNWIRREPNGDRLIIDPITKEPLAEGTIPTIVRQHPKLHLGLTAYYELQTTVELALGAHFNPVDLSDETDPHWFETTVRCRTLDAYSYEGMHMTPLTDTIKRLNGYMLKSVLWFEKRTFQERIDCAIAGARVASAACDVGRWDPVDRVALTLDRTAWRIISKIRRGRIKTHNDIVAGFGSFLDAYGASQCLRECIMTAKMGLLIRRAAARRGRAKRHANLSQLSTVGAAHGYLEARLTRLGANVTVRRLPLAKSYNLLFVDLLPDIMASGRITSDHVEQIMKQGKRAQ